MRVSAQSPYINLVYPQSGQDSINIITTTLKWQASEGIDSFYVYLTDSIFSNANKKLVTYNSFSTNKLKYNTTYYWKVHAIRNNQIIAESKIDSFTTMNHTGIYKKYLQHGIIKDGIGYFQHFDGMSVGAIDIETQELIWEYPFNFVYDVPPLIDELNDGTKIIIELSMLDKCLYASYLSDGRFFWKSDTEIDPSWGTSMSIYRNELNEKYVIASVSGGLYAVSIENGKNVWHVPGKQASFSPTPAVDQKNRLIYFQNDNTLFKIEAETGKTIKTVSTDKATTHNNTILIDDNNGYFIATLWMPDLTTLDYGLLNVYDQDLNIVWQKNDVLTDHLHALTYHNGKLYASQCAGLEFFKIMSRDENEYKKIRAFNIIDGSLVWECDLSAYNYANILDYPYYDGKLWAVTDNGELYVDRLYFKIDAETGYLESVLDSKFQYTVCSTPVISRGTFIEGGHFLKIGNGPYNDWLYQYGNTCMNHNAVDERLYGYEKMHFITPTYGKIKDTIIISQEENLEYTIPDLRELYNLPFSHVFYNSKGTNNAIYHERFYYSYTSLSGKKGLDSIFIAITDHFVPTIFDTLIVKTVSLDPAFELQKLESVRLDTLTEDFFPISLNLEYFYKKTNNNQALNFDIIRSGDLFVSTITKNQLKIESKLNRYGNDYMVINISDSSYSSTNDTIIVSIKPINDPPTSKSDRIITLNENFGVFEFDLNTFYSDPDGDFLSFNLQANGRIINATLEQNLLKFISIENKNGSDFIVLEISDGEIVINDTLRIFINHVNQSPSAKSNITIAAIEDFGNLEFDLNTFYFDPDNDELSYNLLANGNIVKATIQQNLLYINSIENETGNDSLIIHISDGEFVLIDTLKIKLTPVNDPPLAKSDMVIIVEEDFNTLEFNLSSNYLDPDNDLLLFTLLANGRIVDASLDQNHLNLNSIENENGSDFIILEITDGQFVLIDTIKININPINDPPVAKTNQTIVLDEDFGSTAYDITNYYSDPDNDLLSFTLLTKGSIIHANLEQNLLNLNSIDNENGSDFILIEITDGQFVLIDTISIDINPINDPPVAESNLSIVLDEDFGSTEYDLTNFYSDPDNDLLSFNLLTTGSIIHANLEQNLLNLNSIDNENGGDFIVLEITDGEFVITDSLKIFLNPINDPPFFKNPNDTIFLERTNNFTYIYNLLDEIIDVDNELDSLKIAVINSNDEIQLVYKEQNGTLFIKSNGDESFISSAKILVSDFEFKTKNNLGIRVLSDKIKVRLFPNPIKDKAILEYYLPDKCNLEIYILNSEGKTIHYYRENEKNIDKNTLELDLVGLPSGMYYFHISAISMNDNLKYFANGKFIKIK
jgi:outer membrane protein assembly factor BamB